MNQAHILEQSIKAKNMNSTFTPTHSKYACCLAPTPPTRKRSNEMVRVASMPAQLSSSNKLSNRLAPTPPARKRSNEMLRISSVPAELVINESKANRDLSRNASFSVKNSTSRKSDINAKPTTLRTSSSMMLDAASRKRQAAAKSIALTRAMSSDVVPSLPVRMVSPIKEMKHFRSSNVLGEQWKMRNRSRQMLIAEEESGSDSESLVILQPEVKSNMFFKGMSVSRPKEAKQSSRRELPTTSPSAFLNSYKSPVNLADAARLGASEKSDSELLHSRWSSSSSMTSVRMHESISSSMEFFLNGSSGELNNSKSSLGSSRNHNSMSSLRAPKERGLNRSNSSMHLEETMLKGWK